MSADDRIAVVAEIMHRKWADSDMNVAREIVTALDAAPTTGAGFADGMRKAAEIAREVSASSNFDALPHGRMAADQIASSILRMAAEIARGHKIPEPFPRDMRHAYMQARDEIADAILTLAKERQP